MCCRHEPAAEPDAFSACACGHVPGDPGGGHPDPIHTAARGPTHGRAAPHRTLTDAQACRRQPHQLPGKKQSSTLVVNVFEWFCLNLMRVKVLFVKFKMLNNKKNKTTKDISHHQLCFM